ncbi:MAG: DUF3151 family protein [Ilumatobacteraceae bacterium]
MSDQHDAVRRHGQDAAQQQARPIDLSPSGPPSTVLPPADPDTRSRLDAALLAEPATRRDRVAEVVARHPRWLEGWATLGDLGRDPVERYAAYRVGYHRGLDALRANGWRGSGYVRWQHPSNRGFLRSLAGLGAMADAIGETDEADRIALFIQQLEPSGLPPDVVPATRPVP